MSTLYKDEMWNIGNYTLLKRKEDDLFGDHLPEGVQGKI